MKINYLVLFNTMKKNWLSIIPHPVILLFGIFIFVSLLTFILPSGRYDREEVNGRSRVIAGTYKVIPKSPLNVIGIFSAIPKGFNSAASIIFVVLASGIMFGALEKSKMIENMIGTTIKMAGLKYKHALVVLLTFLFGGLGVFVGYENNIAMIPIAAVICLAINADLMLAAGIAVGGITVGFGLSPINPYTVGVGHQIAGLTIFSGALLRSLLCFTSLGILAFYNVRYLKKISRSPEKSLALNISTDGFQLSKKVEEYHVSLKDLLITFIFVGGLGFMLYGVFQQGWYMIEISANFLIITALVFLVSRKSTHEIGETVLKSVAVVAPGAFMVGLAASIKAILEMTDVGDTIAFYLAGSLEELPSYLAALGMSGAQCLINLIIPSGSGQALATLPVMIPVGDLIGITRQTTILAFQIGDGVTNLFNPTLGGLVAMVSLCRIPFNQWLKFILPITFSILLISWFFLFFSVWIHWA